MRTTRPLATLAIAAALAGCGGNAPHSTPATTSTATSAAACKAAMTSDYEYALAHPDAPSAAEPAPCKGLPAATINQFVSEIMAGVTPSPAPSQ